MALGRGKSEDALESWCCKQAKKRGWLSRKMNGLGFNEWPDRLFIRTPKRVSNLMWTMRKVVFVEFKRLGKKPTKAQGNLHQELRRRGVDVRVIVNKDDFRRLLDE